MDSSSEEATISYQDGEQQQLLSKSGEGRKLSVDDAIELVGMGKFQYLMLLVTGLCFGSDAVEICLLSFLSPTLQAEWDLQPWQASTVTAIVFVGGCLGTLFFGRLGDVIGRRPTFLYGAFTVSIFGVATSMTNDFVSLLATRFIVGMGVGGMTVAFDILAEFLPTNRRGSLLAMIEYFWTFGSMYVPLVAAATLALSWRTFVSLCSVPCFLSAVMALFILPESPRWLVVKGRKDEAVQIWQRVAKTNGWDPQALSNYELEDEEPESSDIRELFKPEWRNLTLLMWVVWAGSGICYFSLVILISRVFESTGLQTSSQECDSNGMDCSNDGVTFDYTAIFVSASAEFVGTALLIAVVDRVGRVRTQAVGYASAGISVAMLCLLAAANMRGSMTPGWIMLLLAYISRVFELAATAAGYIITAELLPTNLRTTGHSAGYAMSRLGGALFSYIVSSPISLKWSAVLMLVAHFATSLCATLLPETNGQNLGQANVNNSDGPIASTPHSQRSLVEGTRRSL